MSPQPQDTARFSLHDTQLALSPSWGALGAAPLHPVPAPQLPQLTPEKRSWLTPLVCGEGLSLPLPVSVHPPPNHLHMAVGSGESPAESFISIALFLVIGFFV